MATPDNESVQYDIRIEAVLALKNLADLTNATQSFHQKITDTTLAVQEASARWGVSFGEAKARLQGLDQELSGAAESSTVFGSAGQQAWNQVGKSAEENANKTVGGINLMRTAMHVLVVGTIFEIINAFRTMFTEALDGLKKLEVSVYNLANAERALSESGIDVTFKDLEAVVDRLHTKFQGLFSKVQLQDAVADIAIATKELGLSAEQIEKIAQASAALQLRNPERTLQDVNKQLLTAILSGQTKGIRSLGVEASEAAIQQKALEMGLIQVGQKADAQAKSLATLELVYQATAGDAKNLAQYQNNLSGVTQTIQSTWQDLLATVAKLYGPEIIAGLKLVSGVLQGWLGIIQFLEPELQKLMANFIGIGRAVATAIEIMANPNLSRTEKIAKVFEAFKSGVSDTNAYFQQFIDNIDTATSSVNKLGDAFDSAGFGGEIEKIMEDSARAVDDLNEKLSQKQEDLDTEYQRKAADALTDYQRKVEDILREGANKVNEIKQKARRDDKDREAKYQLDLWELQQKYLMDLEDALHNRDAKTILRLQRQYAFDKEDLDRKKKLDDQKHAQEVADEVKNAQEDIKRRLEQAKIEYQRKLQDLNLAKAREEEDLQKWYRRELDDLHKAEQRKLEDLIKSWIQQGKITQAGAQYVYDILKHYFGPGGMTDALYQYMMQQLGAALQSAVGLGNAAGGISTPNGPIDTTTTSGGTQPVGSSGGTTSLGTQAGGLAEGGSFLATKPSTIRVGETRPELIQTTPLGRPGQDLNKLFMGANPTNGQEGMSGKLELAVNLSPDLELRVIRKALDGAADVLTRVNNSKV